MTWVLSQRAQKLTSSAIREILKVTERPEVISFAGGLPSPAALLRFDLPVMVAVALACLPIFASGATIARWEGALFLFYFATYFIYLALAASRHDALPRFSFAMMFFWNNARPLRITAAAGTELAGASSRGTVRPGWY